MTKDSALSSLLTAAALATAGAVVVNPIVPSLPDVQIPALFPSQRVVAPEAKVAIGSAAATIPAIQNAVEGLGRSTSRVEHTVHDIADGILSNPGVSELRQAVRSLAAVADPARPVARTLQIPTLPIVASSALAGVQRNIRPAAAVRVLRPNPAPAPQLPKTAAPPPMAAVSPQAPQDSAPAPKATPEPSHADRHPGQRRR